MSARHSTERGVLGPTSPAAQLSIGYGMIYVSVALALGRTVTIDWLLLPIAALWGAATMARRHRLWRRPGVNAAFWLLATALAVAGALFS